MKKINEIITKIKKVVQGIFQKKKGFTVMGINFGNLGSNKTGVLLVVLAFVLGLIYYYKGIFIVAMVNGKPIFRTDVIKRLERSSGKLMLDDLVVETLVAQEAKKLNVQVTNEEVAQEIAKIRQQLQGSNQDLDTMLKFQGMTVKDLEKQIRMSKMAEKILSEKVTVTDEEVQTFITENKDNFDATSTDEEKVNIAKTQIKQSKLGSELQKWLEILKAKSDITYLVKY